MYVCGLRVNPIMDMNVCPKKLLLLGTQMYAVLEFKCSLAFKCVIVMK